MQIGLNVFWDGEKFHRHSEIMLSSGAKLDFAVCHLSVISETLSHACRIASDVSDAFKALGIPYIANFEQANFDRNCKGPDGFEWANHADGTHRMEFPEEMLKALNKNDNLIGVIYDEFEHMIVNRNAGIALNANLNVFPLPETPSVINDGSALVDDLQPYVEKIKKAGVKQFAGEHVFPVLYHLFARCGITPNFKAQKESFTDVQYALAAGAALEYGTELWDCVDMWFMRKHPGHSPEEMYNNLVFAFESGVSRVYVESSAAMTDGARINEYGKAFIRFTREYHGKSRSFEVSDLKPQIGIIRYDDTYWGQAGILLWKKIMFGDERLKPTSKQREYLHVFHLLTHGKTCAGGINWGRFTPWSLRRHRSFAGINSAVVFDDAVTKTKLQSLKLCFLCGETISAQTLEDISDLVKNNGLTVVAGERFLPPHIKARRCRAFDVIDDGKGRWIAVSRFRSANLKRLLAPYIGNPGEITLHFSDHSTVLQISKDGDRITPVSSYDRT